MKPAISARSFSQNGSAKEMPPSGPVAEKGLGAGFGTIDDLRGEDDIGGPDLLLEAADSADGDDLFHAEGFQREYIGFHGQLTQQDAVAFTVTGRKATCLPPTRATTILSEGSPNGVFTAISFSTVTFFSS